MDNGTLNEEDENLWVVLKDGIGSFLGLMRDQRWVEVLIRVGIFIGLVFVVHAIFVWALHTIIIPMLQQMVMDSILEELKTNLIKGQLEQYTLDLGKKDWTSIFKFE